MSVGDVINTCDHVITSETCDNGIFTETSICKVMVTRSNYEDLFCKKSVQQNSELITVTECLPARAMFKIILNIFERVPVSKAAALLQKLNPSTVILFFKIPETTVK